MEETYKAQTLKEEAATAPAARATAAKAGGNDSNETSDYLTDTDSGHYVFAPDGFTCEFKGPETDKQLRRQKAAEERERIENAARLNFFTSRIHQLEEQARLKAEEAERKPAAREPSSHTPQASYSHRKKATPKETRRSQAQAQAKYWAETRKPNPKVWCSPANQRAIREQKQASAREQHQAEYELRIATKALAEQEQNTLTRQRQLNGILAEFQNAIARAERTHTRAPSRPVTRTPPRPLTQPNRDESSDESRERQL